jgi:hypothetical protein
MHCRIILITIDIIIVVGTPASLPTGMALLV